jgi:hypothetical protein
VRALEKKDEGLLHQLLHQHNGRARQAYLKLLAERA